MLHICINKSTIIGSDNDLAPGWCQAINWTNAGILLIQTLGTNFSEVLREILIFSFQKIQLKMLSAKWQPFCLVLHVLTAMPHFNLPPGMIHHSTITVIQQAFTWDYSLYSLTMTRLTFSATLHPGRLALVAMATTQMAGHIIPNTWFGGRNGINSLLYELCWLRPMRHCSEFISFLVDAFAFNPWSGGWININMSSYQYRDSHCGDKTILWPSCLHNGISYTNKTTPLYQIGAQVDNKTNCTSHMNVLILSSTVKTWSNIIWYCIHHSTDWSRIYIRVLTLT